MYVYVHAQVKLGQWYNFKYYFHIYTLYVKKDIHKPKYNNIERNETNKHCSVARCARDSIRTFKARRRNIGKAETWLNFFMDHFHVVYHPDTSFSILICL